MKYGQGPPPSGGWKKLMPGDGSDPDYSPAYQDEYQRLWHEAAARADAAERERDELLIERGEWDSWKVHAEAAERQRDEARAAAEQRCIAHAAVAVMHGDCPICDLEAAEALAERRETAATLARSELDWCIGYASTVEHKAWRERLLKRLHVARAALAEDASHQDAGEPGYGGDGDGAAT